MNWITLLLAGTVPVSAAVAYLAGYRSAERARNRYAAMYGVAMAEQREREAHRAHAEIAAYAKIDLCPTPAGCMETMRIGLN